MNNLSIVSKSVPIPQQSINSVSNTSRILNNQSNSQLRSRKQTINSFTQQQLFHQSNLNISQSNNSHLSIQLTNLRRSNLINILSSKLPQQRTQKQNKIILQILKFQPFFSTIQSNYKLLYQIASKLQYKFFKQNQSVYKIHQFTEGYFILIRGSVQLSIPQKIINNTKIKVQSQNDILLRQIEERHQLNSISKSKKLNKKLSSPFKTTLQNFTQSSIQINTSQIQTPVKQIKDKAEQKQSQQIKLIRQSTPNNNSKTQIIQKKNSKRKLSIIQSNRSQNSLSRQNSDSKQVISSIIKLSRQPSTIKKNSQSKKNKKSPQPPVLSSKRSSIRHSHTEQIAWSPTQFSHQQDEDRLSQNESLISQKQIQQNQQQQAPSQQIHEYTDKIVKIVQQGECFGQITVGQINRRATNAKAKHDSHLIMIKKQHYELISKASLSTQMKKRHQFLSNLQLFKKVYRYSIQSFLYYMTQIPCQYKSLLYKQGEEIKYVYLIKSGQFNLSKVIKQNENKRNTHKFKTQTEDVQIKKLRRQSNKWREGVFKTVYSGQIIGDCQALLKKNAYTQSCKCTSQSGAIFKIQKSVFLQKILSSQNQVAQIKKYLNAKYKTKIKLMQHYLSTQLKNQVIARILPPSRSFDRKLKKKLMLERSQTSMQNRSSNRCQSLTVDLRDTQNNFFDQFNRTVRQIQTKKRLSVRQAVNIKTTQQQRQQRNNNSKYRCKTSIQKEKQLSKTTHNFYTTNIESNKQLIVGGNKIQIPTCIKDIVKVVDCKQRYFIARNKNTDNDKKNINFEFQKHKIPIFISQKYKHLLERLKKKPK